MGDDMLKYKSILSENTATLLLYGEVSDEQEDGKVSDRYFVNELMYLDREYDNICIRINSVGGDVYPGIAIFNAIRRCKSNVVIYVDGIAASIASVIALCGRRVEMSKYARLMLHNVSGGCYGNKKELQDMIETIQGLEDTLSEIISAKCKSKTKEEVKEEYFDGKDHWLTADESLELGLIDAIYDVEPVPEESSTDDIYRIFTNRLEKQQEPKKENDMNLEELKKNPRFANCADDAGVIAVINGIAERADAADAIEKENDDLKIVNETLSAEITEIDNASIDAAIADGRLAADQKDVYQNLIKADRKNGRAALAALKPKKMVKDTISNEPKSADDDLSPWDKRMKNLAEKRKK